MKVKFYKIISTHTELDNGDNEKEYARTDPSTYFKNKKICVDFFRDKRSSLENDLIDSEGKLKKDYISKKYFEDHCQMFFFAKYTGRKDFLNRDIFSFVAYIPEKKNS